MDPNTVMDLINLQDQLLEEMAETASTLLEVQDLLTGMKSMEPTSTDLSPLRASMETWFASLIPVMEGLYQSQSFLVELVTKCIAQLPQKSPPPSVP